MSQFIDIEKQLPIETRSILQGLKSKIIQSKLLSKSNSMRLSNVLSLHNFIGFKGNNLNYKNNHKNSHRYSDQSYDDSTDNQNQNIEKKIKNNQKQKSKSKFIKNPQEYNIDSSKNHFKFMNLQTLLEQKTNQKYSYQLKQADLLQNSVLKSQYHKMKQNLQRYGRSKDKKIQNIMRNKKKIVILQQDPNEDENDSQNSFKKYSTNYKKQIQKTKRSKSSNFKSNKKIDKQQTSRNKNKWTKNNSQKIKSYSYNSTPKLGPNLSANSKMIMKYLKREQIQRKNIIQNALLNKNLQYADDRVVFLDRKYNTELAIRLASLIEAQKLKAFKEQKIQRIQKSQKLSLYNPIAHQMKKIFQRFQPRRTRLSYNIDSTSKYQFIELFQQEGKKEAKFEDYGIKKNIKQYKTYKTLKKYNQNMSKTFQQIKNNKSFNINETIIKQDKKQIFSNHLINKYIIQQFKKKKINQSKENSLVYNEKQKQNKLFKKRIQRNFEFKK